MPRSLKPHKVDTVHAASLSADVLLDREKLDFYARIADHEVRAPTAEECKKLALKMLRAYKPPSWEARMWFRASGEHDHRDRTPGRSTASAGIQRPELLMSDGSLVLMSGPRSK